MNGASILLVSADDELRAELTEMLEQGGTYVVEPVGSFDDALDRILNRQFMLVVTDVHLPIMSGFDLLAVVDSLRPGTSVMLIDDRLQPKSALAALRLGAVDYLYRPLNYEFLLLRVNLEVERRRAVQKAVITAQPVPDLRSRSIDRERWINPATRPLALMMKRAQFRRVETIMNDLSVNVGAVFVGFFDSDHNLISAVGELEHGDLITIRQALSHNHNNPRLAALLKEQQFSHTYLEGDQHHVFMVSFGKIRPMTLAVICESGIKPGIVWLSCKKSAREINDIVAAELQQSA